MTTLRGRKATQKINPLLLSHRKLTRPPAIKARAPLVRSISPAVVQQVLTYIPAESHGIKWVFWHPACGPTQLEKIPSCLARVHAFPSYILLLFFFFFSLFFIHLHHGGLRLIVSHTGERCKRGANLHCCGFFLCGACFFECRDKNLLMIFISSTNIECELSCYYCWYSEICIQLKGAQRARDFISFNFWSKPTAHDRVLYSAVL